MRVLIWGCGFYGRKILPQLVQMEGIEIVGFVDNDPRLWGKNMGAFAIYSPSKIIDCNVDQILIAVNNPTMVKEITDQLRTMGFLKNIVDIFCDRGYFELLIDQRIRFIEGFSKWIYANDIVGDVAECGVFRGDSAKYINKFFSDRNLFLCDTFEGFDQKDLENEKKNSSKIFVESRFADKEFFAETSVDLVMNKMPYPEKVIIRQGYFPETMKDINNKFAFVNLDMDLYIPMFEGLNYFWDKMSEGGCILLHDYFSSSFSRVRQAVNDFEERLNREVIKFPIGDECSLAILRN